MKGYEKLKLLTQLIAGLTVGMNQSSRTFINSILFTGPEVATKSEGQGSAT